jgi:hypothetical protein
VREERVILKNHPESAFMNRNRGQIGAFEQEHFAAVRRRQTGDDPQQRRLAAAAGTK